MVEIKGLFSVALLKFNKGSREQHHSHAFNALTWFVKGKMYELDVSGVIYEYGVSVIPKLTKKNKVHRVVAREDSWCLTLRGPWSESWFEYDENKDLTTHLTHGRVVTSTQTGVPQRMKTTTSNQIQTQRG